MSDIDTSKSVWPSYALRAWLAALLAATNKAKSDLEERIDATEKELARLRRQRERTNSVIQSLQGATSKVDAHLSQILDFKDTVSRENPEPESSGEETGPASGHGGRKRR
jgi:ABC-type transporter Mla subunit MlaD